MILKFYRYAEVQIPQRMHSSDTGADVYMPEGGVILPGETKVVPLGFGIEVPNGYSARLQARTSIAKKGIIVAGCAIDAGYTGEIHAIIHNVSKEAFVYDRNDRLCYIEMYPTVYPFFVENYVERENKAFGSTGK